MPGTERILKGALSLPFILKLIKSQTQPDGGEGYSGMQPGIRRRCLERRPPCYDRVPRAHGVMNKNRDRRVWLDEPATQGKVLYP